ncbi:hypothetical protein BH10ACT11_BH10ACT11_19890 [soil metagenome]
MRAASIQRSLGLTAAMVACIAVFGAPAASAAQPHCGDLIKKDVKLTKNLDCSASNSDGLDIGANRVTIDLNGHKIIGPAGSYYGIYVSSSEGWDNLTVKNGTISGFDYSVYTYYSSNLHVSNMRLKLKGTNDDYGLYLYYSRGLRVSKTKIDNAYYGAYIYDAPNMRITKSKVTGSDDTQTYGFYPYYATGTIDDVEANGAYYGAYLTGYSDGLTVKNSTFNDAGYAGVYASNSTPLVRYDYILRNNTANNSDNYGFYANYDVGGSGNKAKGAGTQNFHNVPH